MTFTNPLHARRGFRRAGALTLTAAALALALLAAAPAKADHREAANVIISNSGITLSYRNGYDDRCVTFDNAWAAREYERGVRAGHNEGFNSGYRDGLRGNCLADAPRIDFCHLSRPFQDGYRSAYSCEYRDGFDKGRCERQCQLDRERQRDRDWDRDRQWNRGHG